MENQNNPLNKLKNGGKKIKSEVGQKITTYMLSAFGLVAGLAWNDAIKSLIEYFFPNQQNSVTAKLIYAALLTLIVVLVTIFITRLFAKQEKEADK
jgi:fructose-specific phosphotransferase system IIC component